MSMESLLLAGYYAGIVAGFIFLCSAVASGIFVLKYFKFKRNEAEKPK